MDKFKFKKRILFFGVPDMAYVGLDMLFYSKVNIIGVIGPKKTHNTYNAFRNFVTMRNLNFIEYDKISDDELLQKIVDLKPDLGVVCSFNDKLPSKILNSIKDGVLNIHPSLLPLYRGGNPYTRTIINGEKETGVTLHFMAEEFDTGDIVYQEKCPIDDNETMGTLFYKTNNIGCKQLLRALLYYEQNNSLPRIKQADGVYVKAPNIKDEEKVLDYNKSAVELERTVRSLNPYLSACTFFNNQYIVIHKVSIEYISGIDNFKNGEICKIENNKVFIKTSDGCIVPEVMQYAGYFTGNCEDFIRIVKPKVGDKFQNGFT